MGIWPKPENILAPEGHYVFRLREEPEFEPFDYTDKKTGKRRQSTRITFFAIAQGEDEHVVREQFPVWDTRYADLCAALGVDHGHNIKMSGSRFQADVIHEESQNDPTKKYARLFRIAAATVGDETREGESVPPMGDDEIPF